MHKLVAREDRLMPFGDCRHLGRTVQGKLTHFTCDGCAQEFEKPPTLERLLQLDGQWRCYGCDLRCLGSRTLGGCPLADDAWEAVRRGSPRSDVAALL